MPGWSVHYAPRVAALAVLVGRTVVRQAPLTLEGATAWFRDRDYDATDLRLARWEHPRSGALGSFVELGAAAAPLRLGCDRLLADDRYSTAPSARVDGWLDRDDFDALLAALEAVGRRARGEPEPRHRQVDRGPRTLTLRANAWRGAWKTPALIFALLAAVVGLAGLGSLFFGEAALVAGVVVMPLTCWGVILATTRRGRTSQLVVDGFELRLLPGDGTTLTVDARYVGVEPLVHAVRGRVHFDFPVVHLRPPLSEEEIAIGTDDLRLRWDPELEPGQTHAPAWLVGPAGWRLLLETLGLDRFRAPE